MPKNIQKNFFVFDIIASELVVVNCLSGLPMCQQTALGFCVSLKKTFSNATTFTVINKYCKGAAIQIATVFVFCFSDNWI